MCTSFDLDYVVLGKQQSDDEPKNKDIPNTKQSR